MQNKKNSIRAGTVCWGEDGIFRHIISAGMELTLEDIKEGFAAHAHLTGGKKTPFLVDMRKAKFIKREARTYIASEEAANQISAAAVVTGSPISRVLGIFFLGPNRPHYPVKLFISEKKAIEWLKNFR